MNELPNNINNKPKIFCADELSILKERYTDEELHKMWNSAFKYFLDANNSKWREIMNIPKAEDDE